MKSTDTSCLFSSTIFSFDCCRNNTIFSHFLHFRCMSTKHNGWQYFCIVHNGIVGQHSHNHIAIDEVPTEEWALCRVIAYRVHDSFHYWMDLLAMCLAIQIYVWRKMTISMCASYRIYLISLVQVVDQWILEFIDWHVNMYIPYQSNGYSDSGDRCLSVWLMVVHPHTICRYDVIHCKSNRFNMFDFSFTEKKRLPDSTFNARGNRVFFLQFGPFGWVNLSIRYKLTKCLLPAARTDIHRLL